MNYNNYHKHTHYSNIFTPDTHTKTEDYCKRAIELGQDKVFTTEHGYGGDVFNAREICDSFGLKCLFGCEGYIVPNANEKDASNYHIFIAPKNNNGRLKLNKVISRANRLFYYYKPRFNIEDLLNLDPNGFIITTACVAGIARDDTGIKQILEPLLEHFKENIYLEVQSHLHERQIKHNQNILKLKKEYGLKIISANDSHYIYPEDSKIRLEFLAGKHINYGEEDSFILDYPSYDEIIDRYIKQGVLTLDEAKESLYNTLIFDECETVNIDKSPKMPTIFPDKSMEEKFEILKEKSYNEFKKIIIEDKIPDDSIPKYMKKLDACLQTVHDTMEMKTPDYFILDNKIVDIATNKYGGVITRTGRGSGGAFYLNRVLGLTQLDSFTTDIPIYPDRFMSTARVLENRSYPDIDINVVSQEPFVKASKDLLGEFGCIPMLAFGTMQLAESFRNKCRSMGLQYSEYNEVAKDIEKYKKDSRWKNIIEDAEKLVDVIVSGSVHPCAHVLLNNDIEEEIGCVRLKENICCVITSDEADTWKYLKNDYLIVTVWDIIDKVFKEIGKPIMSLRELRESIDDKVWDVYSNGLTCTINQVDSDWGTSLSKRYKPKSIDEVAKLTAAIRPSFDPWRETFIARKPYTNHNDKMDVLLSSTDHYILFQENIMQYFEWLGISPATSIGLIKKISKKKIKEEDFKNLEETIKNNWIKNTGSDDAFIENWNMIQSCMSYGFNCISGDTRLMRAKNGKYSPTISEMYRICNDRQYAKENGHLPLYSKYRTYGYGVALSMFKDGRVRENKIIGIKPAGIKKTYKVITKTGRTIICTDNHKFPTPKGKMELKDIGVNGVIYCIGEYEKTNFDSSLTDGNYTKNYPKIGECGFRKIEDGASVIFNNTRKFCIEHKKRCTLCGKEYDGTKFELHHRDLNRKNNNVENFQWLCNSCHKKIHYKYNRRKKYEKGIPVFEDIIISIEYVGEEEVYDISMADPAHNFVVESGIVTANSPHAIGYGYDSVYGAYLKSHYPVEYYATTLNLYDNDQERTSKLIEEMGYYGLILKGIKFRHSKSNYSYDKNKKEIYKGMKSIKFMNTNSTDELYALRDNEYPTFTSLLYDIFEKTTLNTRQLEILIRLDFFSEFGNAKELMRIYTIFSEFNNGKQKQIAKSKVKNDVLINIIERNCRQTEKSYLELNITKILDEVEEYVKALNLPDFTIRDKMADQKEYLGYIDFSTGKPEDRFKLIVTEITALFTKDKEKCWARRINAISLGTGKKQELTIYEKYFSKNQLIVGDCIQTNPNNFFVKKWNDKDYWYLTAYNIIK